MKTANLIGPALDWAVGTAAGVISSPDDLSWYNPSDTWSQGGPIIEREKFCTPTWDKLWKQWRCNHHNNAALSILSPTPLIAAMRCYVASKLGDEIEIPKELQ